MKQYRTILLVLIALVISVFSSCIGDDDSALSAGIDNLTFSEDTVRFDTVFTSVATATRRVLVYNRGTERMLLQNVHLQDGKYFRINVDGFAGSQQNVEIAGQDSMYLFVELMIDPRNDNNPILVEDAIRFDVNGSQKTMYLEAYGQDVYVLKNKEFTRDTIFQAERPYLIYDSLKVASGATLTLSPNVKLYFHKGAGLHVYGKLDAQGTIEKPIQFRGDRTDKIFTAVTYDNGVTGQWKGVSFDSLSYNNVLKNIQIRNSEYGLLFDEALPDQQKAELENVEIRNILQDVISATNCKISFRNCLLVNAKSNVLKLIGGNYNFTHCTVANYFSAVGEGRGLNSQTVYMANVLDSRVIPLVACNFMNCIISGSRTSEVQFHHVLNGEEQEPFNHLFSRCLINLKGEDDENFVETIWDKSPKFARLNEGWNYIWDFRLLEDSPAINAADRQYSASVPYDVKGNYRFTDSNPDIGCYEYVATNKQGLLPAFAFCLQH